MRLLMEQARAGTVENQVARRIVFENTGQQVASDQIPSIQQNDAVRAFEKGLAEGTINAEQLREMGERLRQVYTSSLGYSETSGGVDLQSIKRMSDAAGEVLAKGLIADLKAGPLAQHQIVGTTTVGAFEDALNQLIERGQRAEARAIAQSFVASAEAGTLKVDIGNQPVISGDPTSNLAERYRTTYWLDVPAAGLEPGSVAHPAAPLAATLQDFTPAKIAARYALSTGPDGALVANPIGAPTARSPTRSISGERTAEGGWELRSDGGPFTNGSWETRRLADLVSGDQLKQLVNAGFDVERTRSVLVVKAERDKDPIVFAFRDRDESKEAGQAEATLGGLGALLGANVRSQSDALGMVSICQDVQCWEMDGSGGGGPVMVRKPVIYLYPERATQVVVKVAIDGDFIAEYPKRKDGEWRVTAGPDGRLVDDSARSYPYLFWEGVRSDPFAIDLSKAFCIAGCEAGQFLEYAADRFGLDDRERTDFVTYWIAALEQNPFNLVQFLDETEYGAYAQMDITPRPDTVIRLFMIFQGSDSWVKTGAPELPLRARRGFTVVEWGGTNLDEHL